VTDHTEVKPGERCVVAKEPGRFVGAASLPDGEMVGWVVFDDSPYRAYYRPLKHILPEPKPLIHVELTEKEQAAVWDAIDLCHYDRRHSGNIKDCREPICMGYRKIKGAIA
jgi:hypothetical protein